MPLPFIEGIPMSTPFTIGVAGHVDHGKTTLVRALTGIDTDRKAEEKARGLSIESGVAELKLFQGRSVALIDVPGHTDFLKNTIRGLNSVDLAILVVAADDGIMPQTREHLEILKFFNAASGLVVLTKTDLADEETIGIAELEINELIDGTFLEKCPIFTFSHKQPELAEDIIAGIDEALNRLPAKKTTDAFRLWIDQVKSIPGHGTVVSGTAISGKIRCNDEVELSPAGIRCRARSLESHGNSVPHAVAGQRIGINLHRVALNSVSRGMSLLSPGAVNPVFLLNADIRVLEKAGKGIKNRQRVKIYLGTAIVNAMIVLTKGERLGPGESGLVQIRLLHAVAALPRDALVISLLNVNTVIAGGRVLETPGEKFRPAKAEKVLPLLTALQKADIETYVEALFQNTRGNLIAAKDLSVKTGLPQAVFERTINSRVQKGELIYVKGHGAIKKGHLSALKSQFKTSVETAFIKDPLKKKVGLSEIAERLEYRADDVLLRITADTLCRDGEISLLEGGYRPYECKPSMDDAQASQITFLMTYMHKSGLNPISPNYFWKRHQSRYSKAKTARLFNFLYAQNKLIRLNDNRFLSLNAIEEIKKRVASAVKEKSYVTLGDCKALFGYGRSGGAHVLDYLNEIGFTVRREDKHYLS